MQVVKFDGIVQEQANIGNAVLIMSPDGAEAVCFDPQELQDLTAELSSGKISLAYLAEQLKLTPYQLHYVVEHLQKTNQVKGELTYSTFTSNSTSRILLLEKAKAHKREHRRMMRKKRK